MSREAIMRKALKQIIEQANANSVVSSIARHALSKVAALPHRIPCGCKVHISDQLTISVVTPCRAHAAGPARALPKRRRS